MPADSHCHLNNPAFDPDREAVIEKAAGAGFKYILNVGYDPATSRVGVGIAEGRDIMYASVGIHPHNAAMADEKAMAELEEMATHPKVVAIGETGLDHYRDICPRDRQEKAFRAHARLARKLGKPLIVHCREAMEDVLRVLEDEGIEEIGGVMHCFSGTVEQMISLVSLGFYISYAGNITYPKAGKLRGALAHTPGHRLLLETDSPYLAPQGFRGKRNDPSLLAHVIAQAAETRGVTREDIERIAVANFESAFRVGAPAKGEIAYKIRNSLYVNVTARCTNECSFCARFFSDTVQGHNLRISKDPTASEMMEAIGDPARYDEIVFCGYGEPTLRLDRILETARAVKARGGRTRLNTNGHGSRIAGRDITPELEGLIDHVSVSMNAPDAKTYEEICNPLHPGAFEDVLEFIRAAKKHVPKVTATMVAIPGKVDVEACRRLAEEELGVAFRVREYNLVG